MKATEDSSAGTTVYQTVSFASLSGLPIGVDRLHRSLIGTPLSLLETSLAVDELVSQGRLTRCDDLVCLAGSEAAFDRHAAATARAVEYWPLAEKWAQRVAKLPFVRMVAVTGGLAIDALGPDEPIEFFVMVRPRRLWTTRARTFKVLNAARDEGVSISLAYVTTTRAPEVEPHSVAMAWELAQLAVVVGESVSRTLRRSNAWVFDLLPNATLDDNQDHHLERQPTSAQKWTETLLLLPPFRVVENLTRRRQIAALSKTNVARQSGRGRPPHQFFSVETCDEHLGLRTAQAESAWNAANNA